MEPLPSKHSPQQQRGTTRVVPLFLLSADPGPCQGGRHRQVPFVVGQEAQAGLSPDAPGKAQIQADADQTRAYFAGGIPAVPAN